MIVYSVMYSFIGLFMVGILSYMHIHYEGEHLRVKDLVAFLLYGAIWPAVCTVSVLLAVFGMVLLAFDKWDTSGSRVLLYNKKKVVQEMRDRICPPENEQQLYTPSGVRKVVP